VNSSQVDTNRDLSVLASEDIIDELQSQLGEAMYTISVLKAQLKKAQRLLDVTADPGK